MKNSYIVTISEKIKKEGWVYVRLFIDVTECIFSKHRCYKDDANNCILAKLLIIS